MRFLPRLIVLRAHECVHTTRVGVLILVLVIAGHVMIFFIYLFSTNGTREELLPSENFRVNKTTLTNTGPPFINCTDRAPNGATRLAESFRSSRRPSRGPETKRFASDTNTRWHTERIGGGGDSSLASGWRACSFLDIHSGAKIFLLPNIYIYI